MLRDRKQTTSICDVLIIQIVVFANLKSLKSPHYKVTGFRG
jgi:hypothetical protein